MDREPARRILVCRSFVPCCCRHVTTLTACLNSTTLVKVKPDGSGTVEQTTLVNTAALKGDDAGAAAATEGRRSINEADLERTAERMGKGVRLVSAEPVKGATASKASRRSSRSTTSTKVQVSQDPNMSGGTGANGPRADPQDDPVKFKFTRGATPRR